MRTTHTSLKDQCESVINDHWPEDGARKLSNFWTGRTTFDIMRPPTRNCYKWVKGRETKIQTTPRPEHIDSETFWKMRPHLQEQAKEDWKVESAKRAKARLKRGNHNPDSALDSEFAGHMSKALEEYGTYSAPAMPTVGITTYVKKTRTEIAEDNDFDPYNFPDLPSRLNNTLQLNAQQMEDVERFGAGKADDPSKFIYVRAHQDKLGAAYKCSEDWFAMVHKPVPMNEAMQIKDAKDAVDAEWNKLIGKGAWDLKNPRPKSVVAAEYRSKGKQCHFGSLMDLCHLKNSEMDVKFQKYKGRVVFRGDQVKNEQGA